MVKRNNPAVRIAQETAHKAIFDEQGNPKPGLHNALIKAVDVQRPLVLANLRRLRKKHPRATAGELIAKLDRDYLLAVSGTGAAAGASAVVPGIGTIASLGLSAGATVAFLEATALYASSVAELHGIHMVDPDKSRTMVMAIMLGEEGTALLSALSGQSVGTSKGASQVWGSVLGKSKPLTGFISIRERIQKAFLRSLLKRQGTAFLGRALPFGIGAAVGGAGNLMMGRAVVANTHQAFGEVPLVMPGEVVSTSGPSLQPELTNEGQAGNGS
ncbi:hypothetical protein ACQQCD_07370 [Pseudarthrobacter sp. J1763]|uniref:hypothetical protein n=1 Tax=Pseudarthrobacter sp. J1763 TaxID=3420445 RepID=UPI003D274EFB